MNLPPFRLEDYLERYEFKARHLLGCSDSETWTVREILGDALLDLPLGYTPPNGTPALREEIAGLYRGISAEQVLVCAGAQEAIYLFMTTWLEPGDRVVVLTPCYESLFEIPRSLGCQVLSWALQPPWKPDLDALERLLPGARLLVMNFPHNPTGAQLTREEQSQIVEMCREHGTWIFSDEVYRESEHRPEDKLPAACDVYVRALSLGVMSKSFGLAGLRIGWLALQDKKLLARVASRKHYGSLCNSAPSELLATAALRNRTVVLERNRAILLANLALEVPAPIEQPRPMAGPVAFPRVDVPDVDAWCHDLAEKGILLVPGSLFGHPAHVRLGLGRRSYPEALEALRQAF